MQIPVIGSPQSLVRTFHHRPPTEKALSYRIQDSRFEQVEVGPAEHLSLDIFEPIYLSLCLPVAPRLGKGFLHGSVIAADPSDKTFERIACCGFRLFDPFFQATLFLGSQELAKALDQLQPLFNGLQLQ
jgi:hypothetical protein